MHSVGCVPSTAVAVSGGGGSLPGGCLPGGGGLPVDRITDVCENITFTQLLLRMVNMSFVT